MALSITDLGLNEINNHVDGRTSLPIIIDNADLDSNDVRVWGSQYHDSTYSGNGTAYTGLGALYPGGPDVAGVNTTSETEISIGEFRNAEAPTSAFAGTMTTAYDVIPGGDYYIPSQFINGYANFGFGSSYTLGSHSNMTFAGTVGGVYSTAHRFQMLRNSALGDLGSGIISMQIGNPRGSYGSATTPYSATATDWTNITVGSGITLTRAAANSISVGSNSNYYYYNVQWGRYTTPQIFYSLYTYFGNVTTSSTTNYSFQMNL